MIGSFVIWTLKETKKRNIGTLINFFHLHSRMFPLHSGYEDSLKSLQRRERGNDMSRSNHEISNVIGRRGNQATSKRRQRFNSFSNGESVYSQEMTLQRDQRCCVGTEKRRKNDGMTREHRRAHSEAENNITETVIHEHPGTEISLSSSLQNTSTLHGGKFLSMAFNRPISSFEILESGNLKIIIIIDY